MPSTFRLAIATLVLLTPADSLASCSRPQEPPTPIPHIEIEGTRAERFNSLNQLAEKSSAIIIASPTGESHSVPLPDGYGNPDSAPTPYVRMTVDRVVRGDLDSDEIDLVSPGIDSNTGELALLSGGPYLLFVTPAMFGPNDPAGGYVVVGGPAGVYGRSGGSAFHRVDRESMSLPATVTGSAKDLPIITKSEAQLLREGP